MKDGQAEAVQTDDGKQYTCRYVVANSNAPDTVNKDPLGAGWFFKMTVADDSELQELLDENAYKALIESES